MAGGSLFQGNKIHFVAGVIFTTALLCPLGARAGAPPPGGWGLVNGMSMGPSAGLTLSDERSFTPGFELTYFHKINMPLFWWITAGTQFTLRDDTTVTTPYLETGVSFLVLLLGGGWGPAIAGGQVTQSANGLVAIAVPVFTPKRGHLFVIEPYWRPTWYLGENAGPMAHEIGLGIRWLFTITPKPGPAAPGPGY